MTDEELIAWLRSACFLAFDDGTNDYGSAPAAADRIEALVKERDILVDRHERNLIVGAETRARVERLEAALRAVVTAKGLTDPTEHGYEAIVAARAALEGGAA